MFIKRLKFIALIFVFFIVLESMFSSKVYADDATPTDAQSSTDMSKTYIYDDYKIIFSITSLWDSGYNAEIQIINTGEKDINNWYLQLISDNQISNIWNASIYSSIEDGYIIKNAGWNEKIKVGDGISFGISSNEKFVNYPSDGIIRSKITAAKDDEFSTLYYVENEWEEGFTGYIEISNDSDNALEDWSIEFNYDREIDTIWNGIIESHEGNSYRIVNSDYNSIILPGEVIRVGFNGHDGASTDEPTNIKVLKYSPKEDVIEDKNATIEAILNNIQIGYEGMDSAESVTNNIVLPTEVDDIQIDWISSNPDCLDSDGDVFRPEDASEWVKLTASVTIDEVTLYRDFDIRVVKTCYDNYSTKYIENYDDFEYLYSYDDGMYEDLPYIHVNEEGYLDYFIGTWTDMMVESPKEAILSLYHVKTLSGMNEPEKELSWVQTSRDDTLVRFRFRQLYNGIPVYNREISVITDLEGVTRTLNIDYENGITIDDVNPLISEEDVISHIKEEYIQTESQGLWVYPENGGCLVWNLVAYSQDGCSYRLLIDANSGNCIIKEKLTNGALVNGKGDMAGYYLDYDSEDDKYYLRDTTRNIYVYAWNMDYDDFSLPQGWNFNDYWNDERIEERATEYRNLVDVYNYYKTMFGRLGCDGYNGNIRLFYNAVAGENAFHDINSYGEHVIEMSTLLKSDAGIMSHEYTHGVITTETGLGNSKIPGAINEAYADIMGELSIATTDWIMLDRDMSNPKAFIDPNNVTPDENNDMGYVHNNSTIVSNACFKMFSNGISKDKLAKLWYTSLLLGYSGNEKDFSKVKQNVLAAATLRGFSSEEYEIVKAAFDSNFSNGNNNSVTGTNVLTGKIVIADSDLLLYNNKGLDGVSLTLKKGNNVITSYSSTDGTFSFTNILPGNYTLSGEKSGYVGFSVKVSVIGARNHVNVGIIEMISTSYSGEGYASGKIVDAATAKPVSDLTLYVRLGLNNKTGETVDIIKTNSNGFYTTSKLPAGNYCIQIKDEREGIKKQDKYLSDIFNIKILGNKTINNQNATVSKKLNDGQLRIVLEWGEKPLDLDSHLLGPKSDNGTFHIYYRNKKFTDSKGLRAELDVDDTTSYGPETTTIYIPEDGVYNFYVHNYSGTPSINTSNATVKVYTGIKNEPAYIFEVPTNDTTYNKWKVFSYDSETRKVTMINEFQNSYD